MCSRMTLNDQMIIRWKTPNTLVEGLIRVSPEVSTDMKQFMVSSAAVDNIKVNATWIMFSTELKHSKLPQLTYCYITKISVTATLTISEE